MTHISHSTHMRGAIVAAAGIFVGALCQASLTDSSRRLAASQVFRTADDATTPQLSTWKPERASQPCASLAKQPQRSRAVDPKFPNAVEIAIAQSPSH
jgi:hypothetical protein